MDNRGSLYFCIGCVTGAIATALVTSKTGRETIDSLRGRTDDAVKRVKQSVDNLSDAVNDAAAQGIKTVRHETENVTAAIDAGKKAYWEARQTTP